MRLLVCFCSTTALRVRMMRRRRRQHLLAVCVLMVVAGGFLKSLVKPSDTLHSGRRLLYAALQVRTHEHCDESVVEVSIIINDK